MFIHKAYEDKLITETTYTRNAVLNAVTNAMRKKRAKFVELFKHKQEKVDIDFNKSAEQTILEIEKRDGKSWVDKIYEANGRKRPQFFKKGG